jgi:uncharacterized membrane protein
MNSIYVLFALRLIHVMSGIFWVGGILLVARFLIPTAQAIGPAAAPFQHHLMNVRKLPIALLVTGWLTVLSGSTLYMRTASLLGAGWYGSGPGRIFGIGGTLALIAILIGTFGNIPTFRRIGAVSAQLQASPGNADLTAQLQGLQKRLAKLSQIVAVLVTLAAACMAVARYWP